eukprot:5510226-Alexandrium_andersonii.AAC.1
MLSRRGVMRGAPVARSTRRFTLLRCAPPFSAALWRSTRARAGASLQPWRGDWRRAASLT